MAAIELSDGQQVHGGGEHSHPGGAGHGVQCRYRPTARLERWRAAAATADRGTARCVAPACAMPGITLEKARPMASAGSRKMKPASGPAMPISKSAPPGIDAANECG